MAASSSPTRFGHSRKPDHAWLAKQAPEEILDPALAIIDTHHHLWDRDGNRYLLDEFLADLATGHNIVATVFEECRSMYRGHGPVEMQPVGETEFVAGIAAMSASGGYGKTRIAAGIIGYADLALGDRVEPVLEAQLRASGGRFRGVRHSGAYDTDPVIGNARPDMQPGLYGRADFRAGLARLAAHGLVLDAWVFHPQLMDVVELARAVPQATIVMCHCGGPLGYGRYAGKADEVYAQWKRGMTALAACPNVYVKLGGMMMRLAAWDYGTMPVPPSSQEIARVWGPYIETCIELFGAKRCNFESNFPVEKMGTGYAVLWNAFKRIAAGCSADEKLALFSGTARRVYGID